MVEIHTERNTFFFDGMQLSLNAPEDISSLPIPKKTERYSYPQTFSLTLINDCNLRCKYCYASQGAWEGRGLKMSNETALRSIDLLAELVLKNQRDTLSLSFFGGEPLLVFPQIVDLVQYAEQNYANQMNLRFMLITNGLLLTEDIISYLSDHNFCLSVSIDGNQETHDRYRVSPNGQGSHQKLLSKLDKLLSIPSVLARVTVASHIEELTRTIEYLESIGFKHIVYEVDYALQKNDPHGLVQSVQDLSNWYLNKLMNKEFCDLQNFTRIIAMVLLKDKMIAHCSAGRGYYSIGTDGSIYLCHRYIGSTSGLIGNVHTITSEELDQFSESFENTLVASRSYKCSQCPYLNICGGICIHQAETMTGDKFAVPDCSIDTPALTGGVLFYNSSSACPVSSYKFNFIIIYEDTGRASIPALTGGEFSRN